MHVGYQQYTTTKALTASTGDLVVMLYELTVRQLRKACLALETNDYETCHLSLVKAQRALEELQAGVDRSYGELAVSLHNLYGFLIDELVVANVRKDGPRLAKVIPLVEELLGAWRTVAALPSPVVRARTA